MPLNQSVKRRVAGYARVSTDSEEQRTSYTAQVEYYTNYIKSRSDWEFVNVYTDEGISATNTRHRDGFNTMIDDALAGKIDLIVTKSVSRFARSCRQIVDMLSDCSAFDKQIGNLQIRADELTAVMQAFIKDNAENAQDQKRYSQRFAEYEKQMNEVESNLQSLQHKKAERLSRKELLLGMISELEKTDMMIHEFDEKLWRLMVEKATVGTDGKLTFTLRNGMEIEV